ncbi:unnamed protein product [Acanthoscelides obtectus]|nr:unnamed protein product [Acanthoscelides obtectus]CAK1672136.1 hypothetical protein AOBTE_LOCUS28670 [Acanthoscelides obtectus]
MATNANKLVKKISFSAKTCRCTNPRCDCYNVISSGNSNEYIESKTAVTDLEDETTYIGGSISREVSKERMLDHENGMKVIWSTKPGKDEKSILIDDSASLAASQFLEYTTAI